MLLRLPGDPLEFGERLTRKSQKQFHKILGTIYRAHNHSWHRYFERAIVSRNTILNTVEPRYKEDPGRYTEEHLKARITVQYVEMNPAITNRFWRSQRTIYPAVTNILSSRLQQSVKTTDLNRNHSLL